MGSALKDRCMHCSRVLGLDGQHQEGDFGHLVAPKFHRDVSGALRGVGRRLLGLGKFLRSHEVIDAPERLVDHVDFTLQCLIETFLLFDIWQRITKLHKQRI